MFSKGTKRKFSNGDEDKSEESLIGARVASSYSLQRQSLLNMSLIKLQLCHMLVEPNLCRSVTHCQHSQADSGGDDPRWQLAYGH